LLLCAVALRPNLHSFGHAPRPPAPAAGTICPALAVWYRVQAFRVRWGLGAPPAGYMGSAGGGVVDTSRRKNSKKAFSVFLLPTPTPPSQNETHPIVQVSKNSKKYKKTPFGA